jgi:hypothetical protein
MNAVLEKFAGKAVKRGGLLLFSDENALKVIEEAHRASLPILGIDGIFLEGDTTRPSLEDSVDFTTQGGIATDVYMASIEFVRRHSSRNLYFEIVFGPES